MRFKDKCDLCGNYGFCKGHKNYVACVNCIQKEEQPHIVQMKLFEKEEKNDISKNINRNISINSDSFSCVHNFSVIERNN